MARMHTRKRGRSKSRKPTKSSAQHWVQYSADEIVALIEKLAKEGRKEAEIGLILRDQHGIPSVKMLVGKPITKVLSEKNLLSQYPSDLIDLIRKAVRMRKHAAGNKRDVLNKTKLTHVESKIKRLVKYYRGGRLPSNWKYDPETAALLVK